MANIKVSVVIPHWNGVEILSDCLDSLLKTSYPNLEIIVSDNASTDGSQEWVGLNYPEVKLIQNDKNYGYSGGCNRGAKVASGDYLVFLNNDTTQEANWIETLADFLNLNQDVAAVQPKIINFFDKSVFDYAGGAGGWLDILGYPFARGRVFLHKEKDLGQYDKIRPVFWASGTAIMVRKLAFESVGGFEDLFFAHQEEIDLCWKFHLIGKEVWSVPSAIVYHKNALTLPMFSQKKQYLNHRNSIIMILSNYKFPLTIYILPIRISLELVALIYSVLCRDINHFVGIIRSLAWIITHPHKIFYRRLFINKIRKVEDRVIVSKLYWGSVVFDYYIKRITKSSDIIKE